jgi:xanthine dehydrogenase molybdopterin-binding subunit B
MPGVVRIVTAPDLPASGKNWVGTFGSSEKLLLEAGDPVWYIGQSVAIVLADTFEHALAASRAVNVTYGTSPPTPIVSISVRCCAACGSRWCLCFRC